MTNFEFLFKTIFKSNTIVISNSIFAINRYDLPGFTWMLKCPFHLPYLTELYAAFPDATVVWTHRNPVECIASACSLYETLLHMCCIPESISRHALGKAGNIHYFCILLYYIILYKL